MSLSGSQGKGYKLRVIPYGKMSAPKPFDILVIESSYEYLDIPKKRWLQKRGALEQIGELCRKYEIPVRVPNGNWFVMRGFCRQLKCDSRIKELFNGCDYLDGLDNTEIMASCASGQARVVVTGGFLDYAPYDFFMRVLDAEPDLDPGQMVNMDRRDLSRKIMFPYGCVEDRAATIHMQLLRDGANPSVVLDGRSTVASREGEMDPDAVYLVLKVGKFANGETYLVTAKSPRTDFIPE